MGRYITATLTIAAGALFMTACGSNNPTTKEPSASTAPGGTTTAPAGTVAKQQNQALVRFINATPEQHDLYFGNDAAFSAVNYKQVTGYKELPAERQDFKLFGVNANTAQQPLATNSEGLSAGKHYTVIASRGADGKATLNVINDDLTAPAADKAKIRVLNANPAIGDVAVYTPNSNDALLSGVGFNDASDYKEVDSTLAEVDVRKKGTNKNELRVSNLHLAPGKLYTILIMGQKNGPVVYERIADTLEAGAATTAGTTGE